MAHKDLKLSPPPNMKPHLASITYRGKSYAIVVFRPAEEPKVQVSLDEFKEAYPEMFIMPGTTLSVG